MQHRTLVNFALALLLITLGVLAWLKPGIEKPVAAFDVIIINLDSIQSIRAEKKGQLVYLLKKVDGTWFLTEPFNASADPATISRLINKTRLVSNDRYAAGDVDLEEMGLVTPFMKFVFDETEMLVGENEPISQRRYVKSGDWVYLVDGLAIFSLDRKASTFVLEQPTTIEPVENN